MNNFDKKLREGLNPEDEAVLDLLEYEPGLFAQLGALFTGTLRFWTVFAFFFSLALFVLALWSVWNAMQLDDLKTVLLWLTLAIWAFIALGLVKMWFWLRMNHLQTLRALKIISAQIARGKG